MKYRVSVLIAFAFFLLSTRVSLSQTSISGIINSYSVVDSIYPTKDTIEVATPSLFDVGDTVMVYQAQGAVTYTDETNNWELLGTVRNTAIKAAGKYEIILVKNKIGSKIILKASLNNNYNPNGKVQLIRIPSYDNATVSGELTCPAWDGAKGGVLVLLVSDTLTLNANINVTGKGFRGADGVLGNGVCAETDSVGFQKYFYPESFTESGRKGEGIALHPTDTTVKGVSPWANGGGGGNARFSGGGGGGNFNNGGRGGFEDTLSCKILNYLNEDMSGPWEGLSGRSGQGLNSYINNTTVFFGGGGGSGTRTSLLTASTGGAGGGMVVIMSKYVKANGKSVISNGSDVTSVVTGSGAGGGAGGAIVFDVDSVNGNLLLSVAGGKGGNTTGSDISGPGGGGSGGIVLNARASVISNISLNLAPGKAGVLNNLLPVENTFGATEGNAGSVRNNIKVPLNGFLFNSIVNNQQVCKDDVPDLIVGSNPRGGNGVFTYKWQSKTNSSIWSDIAGATNHDYQPLSLTDTTYYRRVVASAGIVDTSYSIKIDVHAYIVNNLIFGDDLITCIGNEADTITGTKVQLGGNNISYNYLWEYSYDAANWNKQTALNDTTFLHGIVTDTTFVRRIVISGACYDTTLVPLKITGLPKITNNILPADQEICYGQEPVEIAGAIPKDGDGTYTVYWESRNGSSLWSVVTDSTRYNLAPSNLIETMYYRRVIKSDDCIDVSDSLKVNVLPLIKKDSIINPSLIYTCYNTEPVLIKGSQPEGGDGLYNYQWQRSINGILWTDITDNANGMDYQPLALTSKTYYRRLVSSGVNGCCNGITDTIEVGIYSLPVSSITSYVDTICSEDQVSLNFSFSSGKQPYSLTYNDGDADFVVGSINSVSYVQNLNPATLDESKNSNYTIVSVVDDNGCEATSKDGLVEITIYGLPVSNPGAGLDVCLLGYQLDAVPSLGSGVWSQVSGIGNTSFDNTVLPNAIATVDLAGVYTYKWKETNWQCVDSANIELKFYESPVNVNAGADTTLFFTDEFVLKGHYENPDIVKNIVSLWEMITGTGLIENPGDSITNITGLFDTANEGILIKWTISKGVCEDIVDSLKINLKEIFTPNGFTPNGDGVNDLLKFNGLENAAENELIIFNRWGVEVFKAENYSNDMGWDGKNQSGNDLPEDTYYYLLKVTDDVGGTEIHKGFIVIKRF